MTQLPFAAAVRFWLKLGLISFGGPAGQIAIMHRELVESRRWISERRFLHALNYCMLLPGPEAQQLATYIGWLLHGVRGGVVAGVLFVLPSLLLLVALAWVYVRLGDAPLVAGVLYGVKPVVVALVFAAAWRLAARTLHDGLLIGVALFAYLALALARVPFPAIIAGAALLGWLVARSAPDRWSHGKGHASDRSPPASALIDDDTPSPPHAAFSRRRLALTFAVMAVLWLLPYLATLQAARPVLADMALFFSKAALLTFGGAYAVLPYVFDAAVQHFGWLTAGQMMDGLALGESTPGPLIMVVAFVGFLGAWQGAATGGEALALTGVVGALVATWFTFLPSFLFILAGGPLVEGTRSRIRLQAPLTCITAAVVGVILDLGGVFARHVLLPRGEIDYLATLLTLAALFALLRLRANTMLVIAAGALAGGLLAGQG